jgi:hypothetical protein
MPYGGCFALTDIWRDSPCALTSGKRNCSSQGQRSSLVVSMKPGEMLQNRALLHLHMSAALSKHVVLALCEEPQWGVPSWGSKTWPLASLTACAHSMKSAVFSYKSHVYSCKACALRVCTSFARPHVKFTKAYLCGPAMCRGGYRDQWQILLPHAPLRCPPSELDHPY